MKDTIAMASAKKCVDHMNNYDWINFDEAIKELLPEYKNHPAYPLLLSMKVYNNDLLDLDAPDENLEYLKLLDEIVEYSEEMLERDPESLEGIFFALCGYGYRCQYYSLNGRFIKAITEGQKAYKYFKKGKENKDDFYEFYFMSGLFKYYLAQYPESHPIVKPMMWFFEDGDKTKGLEELDFATRNARFTRGTAFNYISYLYIRYEGDYKKAVYYSNLFADEYPQNNLGLIALTTALLFEEEYEKALPHINYLHLQKNEFTSMAVALFQGWYDFDVLNSVKKALPHLQKCLRLSDKNIKKTGTLRALAYFKIAQIHELTGDIDQAEDYFEKSLKVATFKSIEIEFEKFEDRY